MKNPSNAKPSGNSTGPNAQRLAALRHSAKSIEHRHERRKIREQLRRLDWAPSAEDGIFA
jgi:hypothetical protein